MHDEEFKGNERDVSDEEDDPMDELEPESLEDQAGHDTESKRKIKAAEKAKMQQNSRRHRTEVDEANLSGDEQEETVFIDNLPNDEIGLKKMLKDVKKNIIELEKQFFIDEDSESEDVIKKEIELSPEEMDRLKKLKNSDLKQFWCIPLSVNVTDFDWSKLKETQT